MNCRKGKRGCLQIKIKRRERWKEKAYKDDEFLEDAADEWVGRRRRRREGRKIGKFMF